MPTALMVQIAENVKTEIVAAIAADTFGTDLDLRSARVQRSYADWDLELKNASTLHIDVVPVEHKRADLNTRGGAGYQVSVDIGIRQHMSQEDGGTVAISQVDRLVLLVEQLNEFFLDTSKRTPIVNINWRETAITNSYVREHLREWRQFTGILRLTYDVNKPL